MHQGNYEFTYYHVDLVKKHTSKQSLWPHITQDKKTYTAPEYSVYRSRIIQVEDNHPSFLQAKRQAVREAQNTISKTFSLIQFRTNHRQPFSQCCRHKKRWIGPGSLQSKKTVFTKIRSNFWPNNMGSRNGTGEDFLDPTGKFQNLLRLTDRADRPVILWKVFVHCSMHLMKNFQKEGAMGEVLKFVTPDWGLRTKRKNIFSFFAKISQF